MFAERTNKNKCIIFLKTYKLKTNVLIGFISHWPPAILKGLPPCTLALTMHESRETFNRNK